VERLHEVLVRVSKIVFGGGLGRVIVFFYWTVLVLFVKNVERVRGLWVVVFDVPLVLYVA
jgi:hypothetical protein